MTSPQRHDLLAILAVVALTGLLAFSPLFDRLDALSTDLLLAARHWVFGQRHPAASSPTVVIALDEQTYRTAPFANLPQVLWTPQVARVQDAVLAAGAKVFGYDVIFPTSLEPFLPGYEKPFLLSLMRGAKEGRVVLGKVQHGSRPVAPHPAQSMVVRHQSNIRALNMLADVDDIIRRLPLFFDTQAGDREPSMALELAARAWGASPQVMDDGGIALGGYRLPGSEHNAALINFQGGADIPTHSLADLYACVEAGDTGYFARHFQDKVVLLGGVLDLEDRKLTSKRLMTASGAGAPVAPCQGAAAVPESAFRRDTIPGVYVLAAAVNDLLRQDFLRALPWTLARSLPTLAALLVGLLCVRLRPAHSTAGVMILAMGCLLAGLWGVQGGLLLPVLPLVVLIALAHALMLIYRYLIADQQRNRIRNLFRLYLEPSVVERMVEAERLPELGGEKREVTVWFSDLVNFTQLSEGLEANELVELMNRYFSAVTDIIEAHGGFVDKYIGDAVLAVFGAPHDDPHHAGHAVAAALTARDRLDRMNSAGVFGERRIAARTGINTGLAVVGNVGSRRHFNYTVMGDTVNLASRLEGANKMMETRILISAEAAERLPGSIVLRAPFG